jgi:hypothetical protein
LTTETLGRARLLAERAGLTEVALGLSQKPGALSKLGHLRAS